MVAQVCPTKQCSKCKRVLPLTPEHFSFRFKAKHVYQSSCRACRKAYDVAYAQAHPDDPSGRKAYHRRLRSEALHHYSNGTMTCACCGERHVDFLTLDHIDGGGPTEPLAPHDAVHILRYDGMLSTP
jgi:hypothetical protein